MNYLEREKTIALLVIAGMLDVTIITTLVYLLVTRL